MGHHHHHHHYAHYTHHYRPGDGTGGMGLLGLLIDAFERPAASVYDGFPGGVSADKAAADFRLAAERKALAARLEALRGVHREAIRSIPWHAHASAPDPGGDEHAEWEEVQVLATRVLAGDLLAYREALAACESLVAVRSHVGSDGVQVALSETHAHVDLRAPLGQAVPTADGTLVRTMRDRLDLYQDYVCGIALRAARELLAALPLDEVTVDLWNVTAAEDASETTGYRDGETPATNVRIASMRCVRAAMDAIAWPTADASEVVSVLAHEMSFRPDEGFYAVPHVTRE